MTDNGLAPRLYARFLRGVKISKSGFQKAVFKKRVFKKRDFEKRDFEKRDFEKRDFKKRDFKSGHTHPAAGRVGFRRRVARARAQAAGGLGRRGASER
jgi:hypothetical protein